MVNVARTRESGGRAAATRTAILDAAERLFAENGVAAVSNRQISEAAGQGNHFAVGYHFGTKADLVREIVRRHAAAIEHLRVRMLDEMAGSSDLRAWVSCLVRPFTSHLDSLAVPSWRARCMAQVTTEPALREIVIDETVATPAMRRTLEGLGRAVPGVPGHVHRERSDMSRVLIVHTLAERERALHEGGPTPRTSWEATAVGLIDAMVGLWLAPVTALPDDPPTRTDT
ncbi:TetR/AcrR family transcriptional regulator [Nonomuraea aridisoli]|uniref:TetR family transcriptional regulator n=1 Tax=Nonomuraea aridisoli TaxID=2070368 RepID=A0A2W2EC02_9ACTN|nr:TetR family transcriptional regulator [Nonomuraea aridisoli]PZG20001.1 TetR family transcriptional regulator [Nonomuraea aridisoli]